MPSAATNRQPTETKRTVDPRRYFENVHADSEVPEQDPVCLYLETTNRCNLLCTTCPRTAVPPALDALVDHRGEQGLVDLEQAMTFGELLVVWTGGLGNGPDEGWDTESELARPARRQVATASLADLDYRG